MVKWSPPRQAVEWSGEAENEFVSVCDSYREYGL